MRRTKTSVRQVWSRYLEGIPASFALPLLRELIVRERVKKPINYYLAAIYREWNLALSRGETRKRSLVSEPSAIADLLRIWQS